MTQGCGNHDMGIMTLGGQTMYSAHPIFSDIHYMYILCVFFSHCMYFPYSHMSWQRVTLASQLFQLLLAFRWLWTSHNWFLVYDYCYQFQGVFHVLHIFCSSAYSIGLFSTPLAAHQVICGGLWRFCRQSSSFAPIAALSICWTINSICPSQPGDFFQHLWEGWSPWSNSCRIHFVNAPWLSEFLRRCEVNNF